MKVLVGYAGKSGTAAECAGMLVRQLDGLEVTLADLRNVMPAPSEFDAVILGGSVRFGKPERSLGRYLTCNRDALLSRPLGLFLCCGMTQNMEDYVRLLPEELTEHAFLTECFGGSLELRRFHGVEKLFVRAMRSVIENSTDHNEGHYDMTLPALLPENIGRMADCLRRALLDVDVAGAERKA